MRKLWQTTKVKTKETEYQIDKIAYAKGRGTLDAHMCAQRVGRTALSDWTECISQNQFNMSPENITCAFKNKASFIKLEIKYECSYYLETRKKNWGFVSNPITWI